MECNADHIDACQQHRDQDSNRREIRKGYKKVRHRCMMNEKELSIGVCVTQFVFSVISFTPRVLVAVAVSLDRGDRVLVVNCMYAFLSLTLFLLYQILLDQ
jgi:hypothetical protein